VELCCSGAGTPEGQGRGPPHLACGSGDAVCRLEIRTLSLYYQMLLSSLSDVPPAPRNDPQTGCCFSSQREEKSLGTNFLAGAVVKG